MPPDDRIVLENVMGEPSIPKSVVSQVCAGVVEPAKVKYLLYLCVLGNRSRAASAAGICNTTQWMWRRDDEAFRAAYVRAMEVASELHEDEMFRRASEGVLEPVYQGGRLVGSVRKFSDTLLIFALKGAMPDKYADRQKLEHSGQVDVVSKLRAARERVFKRAGEGAKR